MNGPEVFHHLRHELAAAVSLQASSMPPPLSVSPWIAMSVLQKAVRRGKEELALRAAASLLISSPERLWRRVGSIAVEDVGLGDINAVIAATASLAGKHFREAIGGEWQVASHVVRQLTGATKCRAADDLLMCAELHPAYAASRRELASRTDAALVNIMGGTDALPVRALATWFLVGTDRRPSPHLAHRRGSPELVFDTLLELGCPLTLVQTARENFRRVGEVLAPFFALLFLVKKEAGTVEPDSTPAEAILRGGVPGWALDVYSREGKQALANFLSLDIPTTRLLRSWFVPKAQASALGHALFRVEGGVVDRRLAWSSGLELRRQLDVECFPGIENGGQLLDALRDDLTLLNEVRSNVL